MRFTSTNTDPLLWATQWLDAVAGGKSPMSQRDLASIEKHGGLDTIKTLAQQRGVHLVLLTDDRGHQIVAASLHPFQVIC